MIVRGVHHVSINVDNVAKAAPFYTDVLGMRKLERPDFGFPGLWLECGGQQIHLIEVHDHVAPDGQHFALRVDDIDATLRELRAKGVTVSDAIDIPGAGRQAFFKDPAGNLIELNQPNG